MVYPLETCYQPSYLCVIDPINELHFDDAISRVKTSSKWVPNLRRHQTKSLLKINATLNTVSWPPMSSVIRFHAQTTSGLVDRDLASQPVVIMPPVATKLASFQLSVCDPKRNTFSGANIRSWKSNVALLDRIVCFTNWFRSPCARHWQSKKLDVGAYGSLEGSLNSSGPFY